MTPEPCLEACPACGCLVLVQQWTKQTAILEDGAEKVTYCFESRTPPVNPALGTDHVCAETAARWQTITWYMAGDIPAWWGEAAPSRQPTGQEAP